MLVAHHAAVAVLAGELAAFEIEGVAVAVAGGFAIHADVAVFFQPAHLAVVGDVAPDQEVAGGMPGRPFGPAGAGVQALDGGVADPVLVEARIERDDIRIGIAERLRGRSSRAASARRPERRPRPPRKGRIGVEGSRGYSTLRAGRRFPGLPRDVAGTCFRIPWRAGGAKLECASPTELAEGKYWIWYSARPSASTDGADSGLAGAAGAKAARGNRLRRPPRRPGVPRGGGRIDGRHQPPGVSSFREPHAGLTGGMRRAAGRLCFRILTLVLVGHHYARVWVLVSSLEKIERVRRKRQ